MNTSIMSFMLRPALVILVNAILSCLPHGSSQGWNYVVTLVKHREFRGFPSVH